MASRTVIQNYPGIVLHGTDRGPVRHAKKSAGFVVTSLHLRCLFDLLYLAFRTIASNGLANPVRGSAIDSQ